MTPLNLEEIQSRLDRGVASLTDTHDLLREVERLRELLLDAGWPRESEGLAVLALQYERSAVVKWIRHLATDAREWSGVAYVYDGLADAIESGEHRHEAEK